MKFLVPKIPIGENVIYSGLCEGEKENGAGEKKMLALVDFVFAFFN